MAETGTVRKPPELTFLVDPAELAPALRAVRDYWELKRGTRAMPKRGDIDPIELRPHLPCLSLIEVVEGGKDYHFRLLGTEFARLFGRESTGRTLHEVYGDGDPEILRWMVESYDSVVRLRRPVFKRGAMRAVKKDFMSFESLHMPLSEDGATVTMLLGRTRFLIEE